MKKHACGWSGDQLLWPYLHAPCVWTRMPEWAQIYARACAQKCTYLVASRIQHCNGVGNRDQAERCEGVTVARAAIDEGSVGQHAQGRAEARELIRRP